MMQILLSLLEVTKNIRVLWLWLFIAIVHTLTYDGRILNIIDIGVFENGVGEIECNCDLYSTARRKDRIDNGPLSQYTLTSYGEN